MKAFTHSDCRFLGVRGIKIFKCPKCNKEDSTNYANGIEMF